jgi:hypothetical protein
MYADVSALAAYLKQVPQSTYTGQPDFSQIASVYAGNSTSGTSKSSLAGRRLQSNVAPTGQPDSAEPPVGSCSSKSEMTIYFAFPKSTDDAQWNKVESSLASWSCSLSAKGVSRMTDLWCWNMWTDAKSERWKAQLIFRSAARTL